MHFKTLCRLFNNAAKLIASVKERKSSQFDVDLKGQLISKCLFGVIVSTKIAMKIL
jgi:hypothetical protein